MICLLDVPEDVCHAIRYFGSRGRIFHVHFRNVTGPVPSFSETFIGEGHVDMVQAVRSPGSTLKPFLYAFAIEEGLVHSESLLADVPSSFGGYRPGNFTGGFLGGSVSAAEVDELLVVLEPNRVVAVLQR